MVEYDRTQQSETPGKEPLRICVAGVGGAGSNVLDRITMDKTVDAALVSFQTDVRVLHHSTAPRKIQLGSDLMRGVGAGGDPDLGREAALFSKEDIRSAIEGHDMVFISVGLGGGTGSGAAPVIAEIAKSSGALVLVFAAVPFSFEGRRRQQQAVEALERLQRSADGLILFDNNRMGELALPKDGIQKAFAQADQLIAQSVRAVSAMVGAPGIVKLGLDDLFSALRTSEGRCLFGFGEARGQNRGTEALKKALKSPLINQGQLLQCARNLLVHIVGGESLTLAEVEAVMKQLGRHVPDETQILFGFGVEPKMGEAVSVTLMSSLSAAELASMKSAAAVEPAPRPAPAPRASVASAPVRIQDDDRSMQLFASDAPEPEVEQPRRPSAAMQAAIASVAPPPQELFRPAEEEPAPAPLPRAEARPVTRYVEPSPAVEEPAPQPRVEVRPAPRAVAPAPAMEEPAPQPRVEVRPAPRAVAPPPAMEEPAPQPRVEARPAPRAVTPPLPVEEEEEPMDLVYTATESVQVEEYEEEEEPVAKTVYSPPPQPREKGFRLASVLGLASSTPAPAPQPVPVEDVYIEKQETTIPVVQPVAETVPVVVSRVAPRPAPQPEPPVVEPGTATSSQAEDSDLFGSSPPPVTATSSNVKKSVNGAEQQTLRLGSNEDRGRFKDTEPALVQGEDLDTPTWMRLRRRPAR